MLVEDWPSINKKKFPSYPKTKGNWGWLLSANPNVQNQMTYAVKANTGNVSVSSGASGSSGNFQFSGNNFKNDFPRGITGQQQTDPIKYTTCSCI